MKTIVTLAKRISLVLLFAGAFSSSYSQMLHGQAFSLENLPIFNEEEDIHSSSLHAAKIKPGASGEHLSATSRYTEKTPAATGFEPITFEVSDTNIHDGILKVYSSKNSGIIQICDLNGKIHLSVPYEEQEWLSYEEWARVNVCLEPGLYTICFRTNNQVIAQQLIVK